MCLVAKLACGYVHVCMCFSFVAVCSKTTSVHARSACVPIEAGLRLTCIPQPSPVLFIGTQSKSALFPPWVVPKGGNASWMTAHWVMKSSKSNDISLFVDSLTVYTPQPTQRRYHYPNGLDKCLQLRESERAALVWVTRPRNDQTGLSITGRAHGPSYQRGRCEPGTTISVSSLSVRSLGHSYNGYFTCWASQQANKDWHE